MPKPWFFYQTRDEFTTNPLDDFRLAVTFKGLFRIELPINRVFRGFVGYTIPFVAEAPLHGGCVANDGVQRLLERLYLVLLSDCRNVNYDQVVVTHGTGRTGV